MKVTSSYAVFRTFDLDENLARFNRSGAFTLVHHFETAKFVYCVMVDASGNHSDIIHFKNLDEKGVAGFYGMRMNVDDFDAMKEIILSNDYTQTMFEDTEFCKIGIFESNRGEPRVILFQHKSYE